jgi:phosphoketolase
MGVPLSWRPPGRHRGWGDYWHSLFSPDENNSNRWQEVLEVTNRCYVAEILPDDDHLAPDSRVLEVLSEHQCQG